MTDAIARAKRLESELAETVRAIKSEAAGTIADTTIPGVRKLGQNTMLVRSSMLSENWSPEYWDADAQAALVNKKLAGASTLSGLKNAVDGLLGDKKARLHPAFRAVLEKYRDEL